MLRRTFLVSAAATAACATPTAAPSGDSAVAQALDVFLAPYVAAKDFSGTVLMSRRARVIAQRSYGAANFETGVAHTPTTRYCCASIGKLFTRATIVALEQAGRLSQDDAFARFMPDYPNAANFTVRQLIEHRAGISRDLTLGDDVLRRISQEEQVRRIAAVPTAGAPGERSYYSNNGYRLLGYVIEQAGGGDYGALVREAVFEPRGMRDTGEPVSGQPTPNLAQGYVAGRGLGTLDHATPEEWLNHRGAGSFYSTPNDLLRFARTLPIMPSDLERPVQQRADGTPIRRKLGHDGLGQGYANVCYKFPDDDAELVMMSNIQTGIFNPLQESLEQMLFSETVTPLPAPPQRAEPLDLARAQILVGNYELFPGTPLIVRLHEGFMEVSAGGDAYAPLTPLGGDRYFMRQRYGTLTFQVSEGRSQSVLWAEPGGEYPLRRLD